MDGYPIYTTIAFFFNAVWCLLCARRLRISYQTTKNQLHDDLSKFFLGMTAFFAITVLGIVLSGGNYEVIKIIFNFAVFFLFLALSYFIRIPLAFRFPGLVKLLSGIIIISGVALVEANVLLSKSMINVIEGWIVWQMYEPIAWFYVILSGFVALVSAIFFGVGIVIAKPGESRLRSWILAIASLLIMISTGFWVADNAFALNLTYLIAVAGYFLALVGIHYRLSK